MSTSAQAHLFEEGKRLHLHHGPIDLIIGVEGEQREVCFARATRRFQGLLEGIVSELPILRAPIGSDTEVDDPVAARMMRAVRPFKDVYVTPMATVAGAVADEVLAAMGLGDGVPKAYVNNGGDVAFHLSGTSRMKALSPAGEITITAKGQARGLATSGWQGRSHSLGIADAVTVAAPTAAMADVAATLIANAVDLPGHPGVERQPASDLSPESDLGDRLVTTSVGRLASSEIDRALDAGLALARQFQMQGLICEAALLLQGQHRVLSAQTVPDAAHAVM